MRLNHRVLHQAVDLVRLGIYGSCKAQQQTAQHRCSFYKDAYPL
jgi:hypothetical protein